MKNHMKSFMAIIPLVVGLAGPAAAALSDSESAGAVVNPNGTMGLIDTLLSQYAGLAPGDSDFRNLEPQPVPKSQQFSTFTRAVGPMTSYFTVTGGDRTATSQLGGATGSGSDAAAPAVNSITVAHYAPDTLVGAVASGIAPTSSNGGYSSPRITATGNSTPQGQIRINTTIVPLPQGGTQLTTSIVPIPTPIPPAAALIGSGLAALGLLRKRHQSSLI